MTVSCGTVGRIRGGTLLAGVSCLALACWLPGAASAATYYADNFAELQARITTANGDGDPTSTIVLTSSFTTPAVGGTLTVPTKPITIDTQGFTLSGPPNSGIQFSGVGAMRTLVGTFMGTDGGSSAAGLQIRSGASVTNMGFVQGGTTASGLGGVGIDFGGPGAATALRSAGAPT